MYYITVREASEKWNISERLIRRYCEQKRILGAALEEGIWLIPDKADKPSKKVRDTPKKPPMPDLLAKLIKQQASNKSRLLYEYLQVNMAYSNCRMASNRLTRNQVWYLFKKNKILVTNENMKLNDFVEVRNHFVCVDFILSSAMKKLTPSMLLKLHELLFSDVCGHKFKTLNTGCYREAKSSLSSVANSEIDGEVKKLFKEYESLEKVTFEDILDFHVKFEKIRPFDDGNGRIGRLLILKECLRYGIVPFILDDKRRTGYLEGIRSWENNRSFLTNVCNEAQKRFEAQNDLQRLLECYAKFR